MLEILTIIISNNLIIGACWNTYEGSGVTLVCPYNKPIDEEYIGHPSYI